MYSILRKKTEEEREINLQFHHYSYFLNFLRIRLFSMIFFFCNAVILVLNFINHSQGIGNKNPYSQYYIPAYLFFFIYFFIMSIIAYIQTPSQISEIRWRHRLQVHIFALMMLVWISIITYIDLRVNGGITVYALGLLGLATMLFIHFFWGAALYSIAGGVFYFLLISYEMKEDKMIADLLNGTIMIAISFIISQIIVKEKKKQFIKDSQIEKQKRELELINADLNAQNLKNAMLQMIIRHYIPQTTWKKADLNSSLSMPKIPEEEVDITCLFLDIVSFTEYSEQHSPKEVIEKLNRVYAPIVNIIYDNGGDIDKFIGDAIFAFFEESQPALKSALEIFANLKNADAESSVEVRIGIHSGKVIRGDVGGKNRRDNTSIGDTVNIAARLQTACSPNELIISEEAALSCRDFYEFKEKTSLSLKGKTLPINVFRIPG